MLRPLKRVLAKDTRAGIVPAARHAGFARVRRLEGGVVSVTARVLDSSPSDESWADCAASEAAEMGLGRAPASAVLPAHAYQLQLVELPNVPAEELGSAVRWRIKDLIDYPLEEAVVEVFEMPPHSNAASTRTGYAVVSRNDDVLQQIDLVKQADLRMDVIDIPELCIRNIAVRLPQDKNGVAFMHLVEECGFLTVTRQGVLYLIRRIDTGNRMLAEAAGDEFLLQERIAGIALEVQRSLDYYESHYDCQPITELVLGPGAAIDTLSTALAEQLGLTVSPLRLGDLFRMENDLSTDEQGSCLLAVGAALRSDSASQKAAQR